MFSFHNEIKGGIIDLFLVYYFSLFPYFRLELIYAVMCAKNGTKCRADWTSTRSLTKMKRK